MIRLLERLFTILSIILLCGGFISLIPTENDIYEIPIKLSYIVVYFISAIIIFSKGTLLKNAIQTTKKQKSLIILSTIIIFSFIWSNDYVITLQRVFAFIGTFIFAIYFSQRYSKEEQIKILGISLALIIIFSIIFSLTLPNYGKDKDYPDAWQGIFNQKNILGKIMVLSLAVFLINYNLEKNKIKKVLNILLITASIYLIILSQAKTAILLSIVISLLIFSSRIIQINRKNLKIFFSLTFLIILILSIILTVYFQSDILKGLNKDKTLTGRTELWSYSLEKIKEKPILGYGYASFWIDSEKSPSKRAQYEVGWNAPHAHNGFIDLTLEIGLIGLLVFLFIFTKTIAKALKELNKKQEWINIWPVTLISFLFLYNLTENSLIRQNSIFLALYIALIYNLAKDGKE
jgi:O-antigen ligase